EFARDLAERRLDPPWDGVDLCAAIVARVDLRGGEVVADVLDQHAEVAGGRLRGARQSAAWDADERVRSTLLAPPQGLLLDPDFRKGFALLGMRDLSFDAWVYYHQLGDVASLASAFPDTAIALDHVGGPIGIGP